MWHVELGIKPPSADNYVSCESQLSRVISVSCFFSSLEDKNNLFLTACTEKGFSSPLSCAQIHTSSCVSVRERWRTRPPLFFQQTCARPQTRSRELPASARPASGKHRAQKATAAEKQEKRKRFSLNSSPHAVFREATERGENIKIRQMDFIFCYVEPKPWKLGLGCVCGSHCRVMLYSQEWPISCFPLCSLLALISLLFLSLEETRMTQHPAGRGEGNKASEQFIFSNTRQLTHINFLLF